MMFEINFSPIVWILLGTLVFSMLYVLLGFRHYVVSVSKKVRSDASRPIPDNADDFPSVSVIVYAEDDAPNLEILLPQILEQDYPATFEVIVVNDGGIPSTRDVIARLEQKYSNLYMTFTPQASRSLSRKKLALTLGIKAARFDTVMMVMGNSQIPSKKWLKAMCRNFDAKTDLVIGYAAPAVPEGTREHWRRLHAFDSVRTAVEYLSWAIAGRPYRGTCYNLCYRRDLFFKNKGFSKALDLKYGDDDVFVSEVANGDNTVVELSPDAMVLDVETDPTTSFKNDKIRYNFTSGRVKGIARLFFSSCSWAWWIMIFSGVAASIFGLPSIVPAIVSVVLLLITTLLVMFSWKKTSESLWSRSLFLTVPWFVSFHPVYTLYYYIVGRCKRDSNMSWN